MTRDNWHIRPEEDGVTISRRLPARFDLAETVRISTTRRVSSRVVAMQVRQDMWRRLQKLRGFAPAVRVVHADGVLQITAGGELVGGRVPAAVRERLKELLESSRHQDRWLAHAGRKAGA